MMILTDCLTEKVDEGCLKVANSLIRRMKENDSRIKVISYRRRSELSDVHLKLNVFFFNYCLWILARKEKEVLYMPFASDTLGSAVRLAVLSLVVRGRLRVIFALRHPVKNITRFLIKFSKVEIIALSKDSCDYFRARTGNPVYYLKTGVDTARFTPVTAEQKIKLREKFCVGPEEKVILHVGHLKQNRNLQVFLQMKEHYRIFLVVSSVTREERDESLCRELMLKKNITIIDSYLENIEEVYQMADIYLFPVQQAESCIDVPLSVLEAAACNLPVVTTAYGELKNFTREPGFCFLDSMAPEQLEQAVVSMMKHRNCRNREAIMQYDWSESIKRLALEEK